MPWRGLIQILTTHYFLANYLLTLNKVRRIFFGLYG